MSIAFWKGEYKTGEVTEKIKLTNLFDPSKMVEIDAVVDSGATMLALPQDVVDRLALRKDREIKVRYANNQYEDKPVYGVVENVNNFLFGVEREMR